MYIFLVLLVLVALFGIYVLNLPVFGKHPTRERLQKIKQLANYVNGEFTNQSLTPSLPADVSYWMVIKAMIKGNPNGSPKKAIPYLLPNFTRSETFKLTWFGHSSYLIQVDGCNILVDPVFSVRPSPFQFLGTKQFLGTDFIKVDDLPTLDIVLITHDHYDHLDKEAVVKLNKKTSKFITSIGVGEHLTYWGVESNKITELAWGEQTYSIENINFIAAPARHFSGRLFKRGQTLWSSFILKTKNNTIYLGGDSGYDDHFKQIRATYGPFDLAILECGQYNTMWPQIHMFPEEVVQACLDLNAKVLMPVHWGKYKLALHNWDEPIIAVVKHAEERELTIVTPQLGETFTLENDLPNRQWWRNL